MTHIKASNSRDTNLALLNGEPVQRWPCFSGLINVTVPGLESVGLRFSEVHTDPQKMAHASASTYRMFGFESAVAPLDMCVEAGLLGAQVDLREDANSAEFPRIAAPLAASSAELVVDIPIGIRHSTRVSTVIEAIRILTSDVGEKIVVGGCVPGPFTLACLLIVQDNLVMETRTDPDSVGRVLDLLTDLLLEVAFAYRDAGADFITVHEMGGSPGFIGPPAFEQLVLPRLHRLLGALPQPRVLSVCGNTNRSMQLLSQSGADALSVDHTNDLAHSRDTLGADAVLLGNLDPVATLSKGDEPSVRRSVADAIASGADAIWPGCDLLPQVPAANMHALVDEAHRHQRE